MSEPTPEQIKRKPWLFCKKCKISIKSPTGFCHDCYNGHTFTASPYGLVNAPKEFLFTPSEGRMK